ncbi:MAG TPA: amino acid adenylation domain-containing protein, partial [Blastocatellia bacterium]
MKRSVDWMVSMLGVLKAGAGYACFEPSNPQGRIRAMLADCGAPVLITQSHVELDRKSLALIAIDIDCEWQNLCGYECADLPNLAHELNVAYVVYTSGSTGKPKGVVTSHAALLNLVYWHRTCWDITPEDKGSQVAQSGFDAAVWEIWPYLTSGASLAIADKYSRLASDKLLEWLIENQVTIGWYPPVLAEPMLQLPRLRDLQMRVVFSGADRLLLRPPADSRFEYVNIYGPTEAAAITTFAFVAREGDEPGPPDIGRPVYNDQILVLDQRLQVNPIGAPGQICIGGPSLGRGYVGAQSLTAEKFWPDLFGGPGSRMYKTGDLARLKPDGRIDFIARIDHQVKIRGFRIELGEIESALLDTPLVSEAVVIGTQGPGGNKQLAAYVVPGAVSAITGGQRRLEENYVGRWQTLYDETYASSEATHSEFDITGWNSSYTGEPIPAEEMREWLDSTLGALRENKLERVLEIGSGTGLLLYRLAPNAREYWGTDFSAVSLARLSRHVSKHPGRFPNVKLLHRNAEDFRDIPADYFDAIVINSVVQYFPGWEYLERVLEGALKSIKPGGVIFVGDVRNLDLIEALHTSIEIHNSPDAARPEELRKRIKGRIAREEELVVSPAFFVGFKERHPEITGVDIRLKHGRAHNELTKYRYDVLLGVGPSNGLAAPEVAMDWQEADAGPERIWDLLNRDKPRSVLIRNLPNLRVARDLKAVDAFASADNVAVVGKIKEASENDLSGVDPDAFGHLHPEYQCTPLWSFADNGKWFDARFIRKDSVESPLVLTEYSGNGRGPNGHSPVEQAALKRPEVCANVPVRGDVAEALVPALKAYLGERLPDYMVPSFFMVMDRLPRNSNGKVDRKSLPGPTTLSRNDDSSYVKPRTPDEAALAAIWARLLEVDQVGVHDNFFDLGGHSLLATQVVSAIRESFKVSLPLVDFFTSPTIAELAPKLAADKSAPEVMPEILPAERAGRAPLSFAEQRLWFTDQMGASSKAYVLPAALDLIGRFQAASLEQTLNEIVRRHEILRTRFEIRDAEPEQVISSPAPLGLPIVDLSLLRYDEGDWIVKSLAAEMAGRTFDLSKGPLFELAVFRLAPDHHLLAVIMHHII